MIARFHRVGRRFAVVLGGEGLQSAFGFGLNVALARTLPAKSYGEFALVMLIGGFALIYMRALIGIPACTFIPQCRSPRAAGALAVTFASGALAISALGGLMVAAVLTMYQCDFSWAAGLFIGLWAMRSYERMALFAQNRAALSTISDFAFTVSATVLCTPLLLGSGANSGLSTIFLALALAHLIGIATALAIQGGPFRIACRHSVRVRLRKLLPTMTWSIVSVTIANAQSQGPTFVIAAIAGPAGYAPIAATMAFFSPLRLAASALANMNQPDLAATIKRSGDVRRLMTIQTAILAAIALAYGGAMAAAFPLLARRLLDGRFGDAPLNAIALGIWAIATVSVLYSVPKTLLETTQDFRRISMVSALGALIGIPLVALIVWTSTPAWSLVGTTVSELVVFVGCWIFALRTIRVTPPFDRSSLRPKRHRHDRSSLAQSRQDRHHDVRALRRSGPSAARSDFQESVP